MGGSSYPFMRDKSIIFCPYEEDKNKRGLSQRAQRSQGVFSRFFEMEKSGKRMQEIGLSGSGEMDFALRDANFTG